MSRQKPNALQTLQPRARQRAAQDATSAKENEDPMKTPICFYKLALTAIVSSWLVGCLNIEDTEMSSRKKCIQGGGEKCNEI